MLGIIVIVVFLFLVGMLWGTVSETIKSRYTMDEPTKRVASIMATVLSVICVGLLIVIFMIYG